MKRPLAVLAIAGLTLAACGDDDDDPTEAPATTESMTEDTEMMSEDTEMMSEDTMTGTTDEMMSEDSTTDG